MASASFRLGQAAALVGPYSFYSYDTALKAATASYYVKVELQSTAGVNSISVSIPTADPNTLAVGVPTVTVDQATKTATFQLAADLFRSYTVQVIVNNGLNASGVYDSNLVKSLQVCVPAENGQTAIAVGETTEFSTDYGYTEKLNGGRNLIPTREFRMIASGTFVATGAIAVTVPCVDIAMGDWVWYSVNTGSGASGACPNTVSIDPGVSFDAKCLAGDTSTYNYVVVRFVTPPV